MVCTVMAHTYSERTPEKSSGAYLEIPNELYVVEFMALAIGRITEVQIEAHGEFFLFLDGRLRRSRGLSHSQPIGLRGRLQ